VSYWWLDGYLDFDSDADPKVRDELAQLLAWHRQNELPRIGRCCRTRRRWRPAR
jgi:hypothetical protein